MGFINFPKMSHNQEGEGKTKIYRKRERVRERERRRDGEPILATVISQLIGSSICNR
jgi:hypothetical protein